LVGGGWGQEGTGLSKKIVDFFWNRNSFLFSERKKEQKRKEQVVRKVGKKGN
jgi:hypothetical protein